MKRAPLGRSGVEVTRLAFGTAPIGGLYSPVSDEQASATLAAAWQAGVRFFDTAPHYGAGLSERRLGAFLSTKPRDEAVVCTKVGRLLVPAEERGEGGVEGDESFYGALPFRRVRDYSPRRGAALARGEPRATRSRPRRRRPRPRPRRRPRRGALAGVSCPRGAPLAGSGARHRLRDEPGRDARAVRLRDGPRLRARRRPPHAPRPERRGRAARGLRGRRRRRPRRRCVQLGRARRPGPRCNATTTCRRPARCSAARRARPGSAARTGCGSPRPPSSSRSGRRR